MITLQKIKEALILRIKSTPSITSLLVDVNGVVHLEEVRELEWQGTKFYYPNIRVRINQLTPISTTCDSADVQAVVLVFGENASSLKTDAIASEIMSVLHGLTFNSSGTKLTGIRGVQYGADRLEDSGVWLSRVELQFRAN